MSIKIKEKNIKMSNQKLKDVYPNYETMNLPTWIIENANIAVVEGKSNQIIRVEEKKYSLRNRLNHLSGSEWVYFTNSVLNTSFSTSKKESYAHHIRKEHPTPKPPSLLESIILFFTKEGEYVLDYFMGSGSTLLAATNTNRNALGIDLNPEFIDIYERASNYLEFDIQETLVGDANILLEDSKLIYKKTNNFDASLILIDPPYGDMMSRKKTGQSVEKYGNSTTRFTESELDLGNMEKEEYLVRLRNIIEKSTKYLKREGHIVIFMKDLQPKEKELNLLHSDVIQSINEIPNLYYKGLKIWADQTTKLFPYGYPFSFVANQIHQYIIIFRKD